MALYKAVVTIQAVTQNPEDVTTNSWHFDADSDADLLGVQTALADFYDAIRAQISNLMSPDLITTEFYRLSDPPPRRPVVTYTWSVTAWGTSTLPPECAIVLSYQAAPVSGLPQARRRNRVYLGPLSEGVLDASGTIVASIVTSIKNAASTLLDTSDAASTWTWAVWSPTNGTGADVASGWVDNAFDTQRRRGRDATFRSTFAN